MKGRITGFLVALALLAPAFAAVTPHPLFSDNAVLQRGMAVPIWGTARDGETVTVKFQGQAATTTAAGGKWMVRLKVLRAGGPFEMTIAGDNTVTVHNILVGEVWVASGQSNMEWPLVAVANAQTYIAAANEQTLRLFVVEKAIAESPLETVNVSKPDVPLRDVHGRWLECTPESVPNFSAVGYFFGRDLTHALKVPVGMIETNWGGTPAEAWTSREFLATNNDLRGLLTNGAGGPNKSTVLYNGMIAPIVPYAIKGAIWYQGESNAGRAYEYRTLFPSMIRSWRAAWNQGDFTFLCVQLAPFMRIVDQPQESAWAELREAQLHTAQTLPKTGMAVITDFGDPADIHPKQKEPVGARLALLARSIAYGQKIVSQGPLYRAMKVQGAKIVLTFDSVGTGLEAHGGELKGFAIAGADHKFVNAHAIVVGKSVEVWATEVSNPVAVRYGWADCPVVNLYNKEGLPATPFRTDDFPMITKKP